MKDSKLKRMLVHAYEWFYEARRMFVLRTVYRMRIMSWQKTLRHIEKTKCSIARFGDGEFDLILKSRNLGFQDLSPVITEKLTGVLSNHNPELLLCIPRCLNNIEECTPHAADFWIHWGKKNEHHKKVVRMIRSYSGVFYKFGDTLLTRPYADWISDKRARETFAGLKRLWKDRDLLIVEGNQTCMGVGNDLFDGAKSIRRIIGPAAGAFEKYQEIYEAVVKNHDGRLILMALGPTATILASDLANAGIQALDIGHIDIEYEWFRMGNKNRVQVPGKYTNEAKKQDKQITLCDDPAYLSQIICRIG